MLILKILNVFHLFLYISVFIPFIVNNKKILRYYLYYIIFIYLGWTVFKNKCWLSLIENKLSNDKILDKRGNTLGYRLKSLTGYEIDSHKLHIIFIFMSCASILVLTYKLNMFYFGIIWVLVYELFISINKVIN